MNPRVAKLLTSANAIRRRIWASLPFKVRLAEMLMRLAVSSSEAFGRAVYGIFKKQGVVGLPESMSDLTREAKDFGSLVFKTLMGKFGAQLGAGVEDVMSAFMLRLLKGGEHNIKAGTSLDEARGIVMLGVKNEALNHVKSRKRRQPFEQGLMKPGDEGEKEIDMNDPHALNKLEDAVGERFLFEKLRHIKNDLEKVHEDALLYLKLLLVEASSNLSCGSEVFFKVTISILILFL